MTKIETAAQRVADNTLLTAGARLVMLVGLPIFMLVLSNYANSITALGVKVQAIEVQQAQMLAAQNAVNGRLTDEVTKLSSAVDRLGQTLSPIAQMAERMAQLDRRVAATEARNDAQEERLGRLGEFVIELRATLDPLVRASQQNLPGAPGVRR